MTDNITPIRPVIPMVIELSDELRAVIMHEKYDTVSVCELLGTLRLLEQEVIDFSYYREI